jgi:hypothetical protein
LGAYSGNFSPPQEPIDFALRRRQGALSDGPEIDHGGAQTLRQPPVHKRDKPLRIGERQPIVRQGECHRRGEQADETIQQFKQDRDMAASIGDRDE